MLISHHSSILWESQLNNLLKNLILIILFVGVQYSFAELLDSIISPLPLMSMERSDSLQKDFEDQFKESCNSPGTILFFKSDSTCYNSVQKHINNYLSDSDSLNEYKYRAALYTFNKFASTKEPIINNYQFSHEQFIAYLDEEPEIKNRNWLIKIMEVVGEFINKYILKPLFDLIIKPVSRLSFFWRSILFIVSIAVFIVIIVTLSKFAAHLYPHKDIPGFSKKDSKGTVASVEINWLDKAMEECRQNNLLEASDLLYHYLISWSIKRNRIKRYEWWTNRQFLGVLKKRFPSDYNTALNIVEEYESNIYGHKECDGELLIGLIKKARQLEGKRGV